MRLTTFLLAVFLAGVSALHAGTPEIWTLQSAGKFSRDVLLWPGGVVVTVEAGKNARGLRGLWHGDDKSRTIILESGESFLIRDGEVRLLPALRSDRSRMTADPIDEPMENWVGIWIWKRAAGPVAEYVAISSSGSTLSSENVKGIWVRVTGGIRIEWADGVIDVLQIEDGKHRLRSWPPGVVTRLAKPQTSVPFRVGSTGMEISP